MKGYPLTVALAYVGEPGDTEDCSWWLERDRRYCGRPIRVCELRNRRGHCERHGFTHNREKRMRRAGHFPRLLNEVGDGQELGRLHPPFYRRSKHP